MQEIGCALEILWERAEGRRCLKDEEAHATREEVAEESRERDEGEREVVEGLLGDELEVMDSGGAGLKVWPVGEGWSWVK